MTALTLLLVGLGIFALLLTREAISMTLSRSVSGVLSATETITASDETEITASPTVQAAQPATLSTRTSDTAGTLTMTNSSHGISTGDRIDIYWEGGQCYGATAGTVAGTSVPFTGAAGTVLPAATTAVTACKAIDAPFGFTGDNLTALAVYSSVRGYIIIADATTNHAVYYLPAGRLDNWDSTQVSTNPVAGDTPTKAWFSHAQTSGSVTTMKAAALVH